MSYVGIFCNLDPKMLRCPMGLSYFMTFQNDKEKKIQFPLGT